MEQKMRSLAFGELAPLCEMFESHAMAQRRNEILKNIMNAENSRTTDWKLSRLWFTYFLCVLAPLREIFFPSPLP
jgi:hypothetical protein